MLAHLCVDDKTLFSCFQLSEDIHHPCLRDHHGDRHPKRGGDTNRPHVPVGNKTLLRSPHSSPLCSCWSALKCSWHRSWRTPSIKTSTLCTWRSSGRSGEWGPTRSRALGTSVRTPGTLCLRIPIFSDSKTASAVLFSCVAAPSQAGPG